MKTWFLAILSGALLGAPFIAGALWPLALVGLAPLLIALADEKLSARHAFGLGALTGFMCNGAAIWGIFWHVLPLDWLGVFSPTFQLILVTISWTLTALGFSLWAGLFALVFSRIGRHSWLDIFTASALWVVLEWAGAWWFAIQNFGQGSVVEPHFALAFIGNVLARDGALVQMAWAGGVYALSAFAAATGALSYRMLRAQARERGVLTLFALALVGLWLLGHAALARTPSYSGAARINVAALALQEPAVFALTREQASQNLDTLMRLLPETRGADIVAFPEGSEFLKLLREPAPAYANSALRSVYKNADLPALIDSGSAYSPHGTLRSRVEVYDVGTGISQFQDKRFILPDGEYVPAYVGAWVGIAGYGSALSSVSGQRGLTAGNDIRPLSAASTTVGVLFCNEAMSPVLYRSLAAAGARVFINISSHAWFHGSHTVADQMLNVSIVRAVESRRWYVQASDVAPSFALDPYGRIATSSAWGTVVVIMASVEARDDVTPYVRFGPWVLWCAFPILLITHARSRWRV